MSEKKSDLLDALAEKTGCEFLSDLKKMDPFYLKVKLNQFCIYDYFLEDWSHAISYLEKHPMEFTNADELSRYLTCGNGCHKFLEGRESEGNEGNHNTDDITAEVD